MTYVIGDVHGEFDSLKALRYKLPQNANLIFVGDLVDRGKKSKDVVDFVKDNNYLCVLGNHEKMMIDFLEEFEKTYPELPSLNYHHRWINNGGKQTLLSYEIIKIDNDGKIICTKKDKNFEELMNHFYWLKSLPLYIELPFKKDEKPIVITHSCSSDVWEQKDKKAVFEEEALWSRKEPKTDAKIFNIFGHTIQKSVDTLKHFINVDTGCCYEKEGYGKLSAYCIEKDEVVYVNRV